MSPKSVFILTFCCCLILINAKMFKICELSLIFLQNSVPTTKLDTWLCLAKFASKFNSSQLVGRGFGIFRLSSNYWCRDPDAVNKNNRSCKTNCRDLLDDDLADDIQCAYAVMNRSIANWLKFGPACANVSKGTYTSQCDLVNGLAPNILTSETNVTLQLHRTIQRIVCTAEGSVPLDLSWQKLGENQNKLEFHPPVIKTRIFTNGANNLTTLTALYHTVSAATAGIYMCEASNKYGSSMKTFFVSVEAIERQPTDASVFVAALTITVGLVAVISAVLQRHKRKSFESELGPAHTEVHCSNDEKPKISTEQNIGVVSLSSSEQTICSDNKFELHSTIIQPVVTDIMLELDTAHSTNSITYCKEWDGLLDEFCNLFCSRADEEPLIPSSGHQTGCVSVKAAFLYTGVLNPSIFIINGQHLTADTAHIYGALRKPKAIPMSNLCKGVEIGRGEFGRVLKGTYSCGQELKTVAIKTAWSADGSSEAIAQLKALITEVKMLSYIGIHENIVSLVGGVVEDLKQTGEPLVLFEYCSMGDLKKYLMENKPAAREDWIASDKPNYWTQVKNSITPAPKQNETININDLINFSLQIANGLMHLEKFKLVHGDIATRNVLLVDSKHVKISDFGLARKIRYSKNYLGSEGCGHWRWWAIESLVDNFCTRKSDVWSYGVLLWEIFTFADTPYSEFLERPPNFGEGLKNGSIHLRQPVLASSPLYEIMQQCWCLNQSARPNFAHIVIQLQQELRSVTSTL